MADKAIPTITLAELYENQNQYIDALIIYKNLYLENPNDELRSKINNLKDKIFNESTLEYSSIIDKMFTDDEKRLFHILPHDYYKVYLESQAELKNDETYPEELIITKVEKPIIENIDEDKINEEAPTKNNDLLLSENNEDTLGLMDIENSLENENSMKDDISLDIDEDFFDDKKKNELEPDVQTENIDSIEYVMKMKKADSTEQSIEDFSSTDNTITPPSDNNILNLLNALSKIKPDIIERILKENVGQDASLSEIKLSDLNYVVELLKISK